MKTLVNGIYQDSLLVSDRGLQYGDGVWETLLIRSSCIILLEEHLARLFKGCSILKITALDTQLLRDEIQQITRSFSEGVLKIIITRGSAGRGYSPSNLNSPSRILSIHSIPKTIEKYRKTGIHIQQCETRLAHQPLLSGIKHLNRLEQVLARGEVLPEYQEGVVCDYNGHVIEGTMSNIFIIKNKEVSTPMLKLCGIKGIMRQNVIQYLSSRNIEVIEKIVTISALKDADGIFFTNSVIGFWPTLSFNNKILMGSKFINHLYKDILNHIENVENRYN